MGRIRTKKRDRIEQRRLEKEKISRAKYPEKYREIDEWNEKQKNLKRQESVPAVVPTEEEIRKKYEQIPDIKLGYFNPEKLMSKFSEINRKKKNA